jgi:hypothetical protein
LPGVLRPPTFVMRNTHAHARADKAIILVERPDNSILLGVHGVKFNNVHCNAIGGAIEHKETIEEAAARETKEETSGGLVLSVNDINRNEVSRTFFEDYDKNRICAIHVKLDSVDRKEINARIEKHPNGEVTKLLAFTRDELSQASKSKDHMATSTCGTKMRIVERVFVAGRKLNLF